MEDVVEEIVGEIQDEYDTRGVIWSSRSRRDGELAFRLDGRVSMDDLRDLFDLSDDEEEDEEAYDTVGGFIVHRVGRIPLPGAVSRSGDVHAPGRGGRAASGRQGDRLAPAREEERDRRRGARPSRQ